MKFTRILALVLAMLMLCAAFTACNKPEEEPPVTDDGGGTTTPPATDTKPEPISLSIVTESTTEYVIVYDYKASSAVVNAIQIMAANFEEYLGTPIAMRECYSDIDDPSDIVSEKEILIGQTNRPESIEAVKGLRSGDYKVTASGSKVVLVGGSEAATLRAVTNFLTEVVQEQGDKFGVPMGYKMNCTFTDLNVKEATGTYSYTKCSIMDARIDSYYLIYADSDKDNSATSKAMADRLQEHINRETGYSLEILKDNYYWADYQILVGNTLYSDEGIVKQLGENDYYVSIKKVEVTYDDGSKHEGCVIQVLFGENAQDDAFNAFKANIVKSSTTPLTQNLKSDEVFTNMSLD